MGSSKSSTANNISKFIWDLCKKHDIWITATHIPGKENTEADYCSRKRIQNGN